MLTNTYETQTLSASQQRYEQAEQRLFNSLGLNYQTHYIELSYPSMTIRTLSIGEGQPVFVVAGGVGNAAPLVQ